MYRRIRTLVVVGVCDITLNCVFIMLFALHCIIVLFLRFSSSSSSFASAPGLASAPGVASAVDCASAFVFIILAVRIVVSIPFF